MIDLHRQRPMSSLILLDLSRGLLLLLDEASVCRVAQFWDDESWRGRPEEFPASIMTSVSLWLSPCRRRQDFFLNDHYD